MSDLVIQLHFHINLELHQMTVSNKNYAIHIPITISTDFWVYVWKCKLHTTHFFPLPHFPIGMNNCAMPVDFHNFESRLENHFMSEIITHTDRNYNEDMKRPYFSIDFVAHIFGSLHEPFQSKNNDYVCAQIQIDVNASGSNSNMNLATNQ